MADPQYIEATFAMRVKLALAALASTLVSKAFFVWVKPTLDGVATLSTCESLPWVRAELLAGLAICWLIGASAFRIGRLTARLRQTPVPGTWVWSRTRIRTGMVARVTACAWYLVAAVFVVGPLAVVVTQELYVVFCVPLSCRC